MTIQEVIKSNRPFKRKDFSSWIVVKKPHPEDELEFFTESGNEVNILPSAILADDWIIK